MKTYTETVNILAKQAFGRYMSGSYWGLSDCNTELVATIFEKDVEEVDVALETTFEGIKSAYYESMTS